MTENEQAWENMGEVVTLDCRCGTRTMIAGISGIVSCPNCLRNYALRLGGPPIERERPDTAARDGGWADE